MLEALGYALAFSTGLSFAVNDVLVRVGSRGLTPWESLVISLLVGLPLLWALSLLAGEPPLSPELAALFAGVGVLHFFLGRLLFYVAITGIGASSAAVSSSPTVVLSGLMAWAFLGEELGARTLAGLLLVAAAIYLGALEPSGEPLQGSNRRLGLAAGLSATLVFASTTILVRYAGYQGSSPIMGAAVSYTAALLVTLAARPGALKALKHPKAGDPSYVKPVVVGSIIVALGQAARYMALDLVPVAEAIVLISLFPIHTAIISRAQSSQTGESIGSRHLAGAALASVGVAVTLL